uniref:Putative secreted peptide n=1 Tax=Anopheles braziliensis TaxID=58242 RepID=A0A2M3ZPL2_9DIPT
MRVNPLCYIGFLQTALFSHATTAKSRTLNTTNGSCAVAVDCVLLVPFPTYACLCGIWSICSTCVGGVGLDFGRDVTLPKLAQLTLATKNPLQL